MRLIVLVSCLWLSLRVVVVAQEVDTAIRKPTQIPAEQLDVALNTLAKERGFQLVYAPEEVSARSTRGASGSLTPDEALAQLLSGTRLTFRYFGKNSIGIVPLAPIANPGSSDSSASPNNLRVFAGQDLFSLQYVTDPQIRGDGQLIAYVRVANDIQSDRPTRSIWLVNTDTGAQSPLSGGDSAFSPRWSPDGQRLAYIATGAKHGSQIYVRWIRTGQTTCVTDLTQAPDNITWSPDGRFIAFTQFSPEGKSHLGTLLPIPEGAAWAESPTLITDITYRDDGAGYRQPGYSHVFVVSASGGYTRQLTFGAFDDKGPLSWTVDGKSVLLSGNRAEGWQRDSITSHLYRVSVEDLVVKPLTGRSGAESAPRVSPNGKQIAYLRSADPVRGYENAQLYVMDIDGTQGRSLTDELDRSVDDFQWSGDGRSLYILYTDRSVTRVARVGLDAHLQPVVAGLSRSMLDRPYSGGEFTVSANAIVAFTGGTPEHPSDLSIVRGGSERRLTRLNENLFASRKLGAVRPLTVRSSVDGRDIGAWLVTPPDFDPTRRYPLILEVHGGPQASYGATFSSDFQLYAAAGYVVLYANPRGSTSYGAEFANLIHYDFPHHDYDDLMSAVDAALATGWVDPQQLFVTGGSGGGTLTAWIVGQTHRFRAAAAQKPVINWSSFTLTSDEAVSVPKYWFAHSPWEDPRTYWQYSPLSLVGRVSTPTLVLVGAADYRTPVSESEQYYEALQLRGVPTALVEIPGASHGSLAVRPSQSAAVVSVILAWFERYKNGGTS